MFINIEKLVYGGAGLGFAEDGEPIFVPMTVPGDEIECEIIAKKKGHSEGKLVRVLKSSRNRVLPKCKYYGECGGCQWQHIDYAAQILWKQLIVEEQLRRIGKILEPNVLPTIPSPKIWNYRNRVKLHKDKEGRVGFYAAGSHRIVEIDECLLCEKECHAAPNESFTQVNTLQNKNLQDMVVSLVKGSGAKNVLELYCGNGNLTFPVAEVVDKIVAADSDRKAISHAISVVRPEPVEGRTTRSWFDRLTMSGRITFISCSAKSATNDFLKKEKADCIILDPPRDGCREVIPGLIKLKPRTIIYISCNPSTLARDIHQLANNGYILRSAQPIDMFPQTYHIETIAELITA